MHVELGASGSARRPWSHLCKSLVSEQTLDIILATVLLQVKLLASEDLSIWSYPVCIVASNDLGDKRKSRAAEFCRDTRSTDGTV